MKPFRRGIENPPGGDYTFVNGTYQIIVRELEGNWIHLSIRRDDRAPVMDWRDLQWIKNQLYGDEREMIQLFPAESRLVDTSNQYHFFVLPRGELFPLGFEERMVSESVRLSTDGKNYSSQRPFDDHVRPADLAEGEEKLKRAFELGRAVLATRKL